MTPVSILQPMVVMFALTAVVWFYMYYRRLAFLFGNRLDPQDFALPGRFNTAAPPEVAKPTANLANLCELPVVFYAACVAAFLAEAVTPAFVGLAWTFVVFRAVHSVIHCTTNVVRLRFAAYAVETLALWAMVAMLAFAVFS